MFAAVGICISACASIGFISHFLRNAPDGWEDAAGFHVGVQPSSVAPKIRAHRFNSRVPVSARPAAEVGLHGLN